MSRKKSKKISQEDLFKSYEAMCIKKGLDCETYIDWKLKHYPVKSSKLISPKVDKALRCQEHIGRELHNRY